MPPRTPRRRRLSILLAGIVLTPALIAAPARADEKLEARLVDFPPWVGPEGVLRAGLEVTNNTNAGISDLKVVISVHEEVTTRSDLDRAVNGRLGGRAPVATDTLPAAGTVPAGGKLRIDVEKRIAEISFFRSGAEDRVYPVRITVKSGRRDTPTLTVPMSFFSAPAAEPLRTALVIPLQASVAGGAGRGSVRLLDRDRERIAGIMRTLDAFPQVPVTLAPSGYLLDLLAQMADTGGEAAEAVEAREILAALRRAAGRPGTRIVAMPYAGAFLPGLVRADLTSHALLQLAESESRVKFHLGFEPLAQWVAPTLGLIDPPTFSALHRAGYRRAILLRTTAKAAPSALTPALPVEIRGDRSEARMDALFADPVLTRRLEEKDLSGVIARQALLAETATIMVERPAQRRTAVIMAPGDWAPEGGVLGGLLDALQASPWMAGSVPDAILQDVAPGPVLELAGAEAVAKAGPETPPREYFDALRRAERSLEKFSQLKPGGERLKILARRLLAAESAELWTRRSGVERGRALAAGVESDVKDEFKKISPPAPQTVTFSSRSGTIPLLLQSRVDYRVSVVIKLESDKLRFPDRQKCGAETPRGVCLIPYELLPRAQTIEIRAVAQSSGRFPVRMSLLTPGPGGEIGASRLLVRSTDYDRVGLSITAGAALFMIVWWLAGVARKRRLPQEPAAASGIT